MIKNNFRDTADTVDSYRTTLTLKNNKIGAGSACKFNETRKWLE